MISRIHQRLGTAGFIISIVALVAALGGGAYAASGGLNGKQKKEVEKIAKKYAGKPGANGAAGAQGPAGAKGDTGSPGTNGANGSDGSNGSNGASGVSPVGTDFAGAGGPCAEGGVEFEGAAGEVSYACNGAKGSPWTAGGTLPKGQTETGAWAFTSESTFVSTAISFNVPLGAGLEAAGVHFINQAGEEEKFEIATEEEVTTPQTACPGDAESPTAKAGNLCVYLAHKDLTAFTGSNLIEKPSESGTITLNGGSAGTTGARITAKLTGPAGAWGTWAVTAP